MHTSGLRGLSFHVPFHSLINMSAWLYKAKWPCPSSPLAPPRLPKTTKPSFPACSKYLNGINSKGMGLVLSSVFMV